MPEMDKEHIMDSEHGPRSPTVAHQTDLGQKDPLNGSSLPETNNTEDSDAQKNTTDVKMERFSSPSPILRSEGVDGDSEDGNASPRSTEDSQTAEDWDRVEVRPRTAPLIDQSESPDKHREMRTKSVPLAFPVSSPSPIHALVKNMSEHSEIISGKTENFPAWHPHVYAKPPKQPTPHSIDDILGLSRTRLDSDSHITDLQYKEENSRNSYSRLSMSESSDSEEQFRSGPTDQPLNLCVSKSRSDSPTEGRRSNKSTLFKGQLDYLIVQCST